MAEMTLREQMKEFEAVIEEIEHLGLPPNSFVETMYNIAKKRTEDGDDTPLSEHQMKAVVFQRNVNERTRRTKGIPHGSYGGVTVSSSEEEPAVETSTIAVRYVRATATETDVIFEPSSGLSWIPNTGGLANGKNYILEMKSRDDVETVVKARVAGAFNDGPYEKAGDAAENVVLPNLFAEQENAIYFPVIDPTFHIEPHIEAFFDHVYRNAETSMQKVLISGPQGTGKTTLIEQMAARHNRGFFRMSCGMVESPAEWFGFRDVRDGNLMYVPSAFIEACETPNTDICLDEFNRLHTSLANGLYNILDDHGMAWIDFIKRNVHVAAGVVFWATANIGAAHTGTFQIDAAMEDRFAYHVKMGYLPEEDEIKTLMVKTGIGRDLAKNFVKVARQLRDNASDENNIISKPISIRQLLAVCTLVVGGMRPIDAVEFTIMPKYSDEGGSASEQAAVRKAFQLQFGGRAVS